MPSRDLPVRPNLEQYRKQARELLDEFRAGQSDALARFREHHPGGRKAFAGSRRAYRLSDAQCVLAREHGFDSWPKFARHVDVAGRAAPAPRAPQVIQLQVPTRNEVNLGVFSRDGSRILTATEGEPVRLWDPANGSCLRELGGYSNHAWALKDMPDGPSIIVGCRDGRVRVVDLADGRVTRMLTGHRGLVRCVDATADLAVAISGGMQDQALRVWDVVAERCVQVLDGHQGGIYCVALDGEGHRALSGARDGTVRLWDLDSARCVRVLDAHTYHVHAVAWAADGRRALSCSQDIRLWDLASGRCLRVFEGHTDTIRSVVWSPDQRLALSAAHDQTVRVWDVESGACVRVLTGHSAGVIDAVWGSGGRALSCDWNGELRVWELGA
jgi:WD40 repeat protein